jgi:hypothetical protein
MPNEKGVMVLMKLPIQSPPVLRNVTGQNGPASQGNGGVEASQSACDGLTGLAQQMCYAAIYGIT